MSQVHPCKAIVIRCIDHRIDPGKLKAELCQLFGFPSYDDLSLAGGAKSIIDDSTRKIILHNIDLSFRLHCIKEVVITNHLDCGAYGTAGTEEKLISDLFEAKRILLDHFSGLRIHLVFIRLFEKDGTWQIICEKESDKDLRPLTV